MVHTPELSVIIVSWQVKDLLLQTLQSLFITKQTVVFEVIVIDNASQDGSALAVKNKFPQVKLIANQLNQGFAVACHQGASLAKGNILLFLNDDTKIFDKTLDQVCDFFEHHQNVGVMGCQILNPDLSLQSSVRLFPKLYDIIVILLKLHHFFPTLLNSYLYKSFDYQQKGVVDQVMGAFFVTPKVVWNKLAGFDKNFFIWFEEVDYCVRAKLLKYQVVYNPSIRIIHYGGASFHQLHALPEQILFNTSVLTYVKKHFSFTSYLIVVCIIPLNLLLTLFVQIFELLNWKKKKYV
jgi:GT2 family glycosyltransferase